MNRNRCTMLIVQCTSFRGMKEGVRLRKMKKEKEKKKKRKARRMEKEIRGEWREKKKKER